MPAIAMTDHGAMFGALDFYEAGRRRGREAHPRRRGLRRPGLSVRPQPRRERGEVPPPHAASRGTRPATATCFGSSRPPRLEGFYHRPRIDKALLAEHAEGIVGLSGCLSSEVSVQLLNGQDDKAVETAAQYRDIFEPGSYFIELQDHGLPEQRRDPARAGRGSRRSSACRWWQRTTCTTRCPRTRSRTTCCFASSSRRCRPTRSG